MWGGAEYERIAERFAPIHELIVRRIDPNPAERWLDVATGTGGVALGAARAGAEVTGLDLAPALLAQARAKAEREGLQVDWKLGNAEALELPDVSFDVVSSCFGIIFAPDREAVAAELARVCRSGGRLALANWRPNEGLHAVYSRFAGEDAAGMNPDDWGDEQRVEELLGPAFELQFEEHTWHLEGDSPEAVWQLMTSSAPPVKAFADSLDAAQREELHAALVDYWRGFAGADGRVSEPRRYLLVLGTRR